MAVTRSLLRAERARTPGRATWLTVVGLVLVPLVVGGLLTWALWKPTERLDRMQAAVVNEDTPVEVGGRTVPLGRQLASALVTSIGAGDTAADAGAGGSDDDAADVSGSGSSQNLTWVLTDGDDAAAGLADGTYATVVTIPEGFSAAATSSAGAAAEAVRATIDIATSDRARLVDGAVARAVTSTAVQVLGDQLTVAYLDNVYVGFTTLGAGLDEASAGAGRLATGADDLGSGAAQVATGTSSLADGLAGLGSGADDLAVGVDALADGAAELAAGLDQLATRTAAQATVPSTQPFIDGLDAVAAGVTGPGGLAEGAGSLADGSAALSTGVTGLLSTLEGLAASCTQGDADACETVLAVVRAQQSPAEPAAGEQPTLTHAAARLAAGAGGLDAAVSAGAGGRPALTTSVTQLAAGGREIAQGLTAATQGLGTVAGFVAGSADGAEQLAAGAREAAQGAEALAAGAGDATTGADELASGAQRVSGGAAGLADGADELADGLTAAGEGVPSYTEEEAATLADVVAAPVAAEEQDAPELFGATSVPFLTALALWIGGLASLLVLAAVPARSLGSTSSSTSLALRALAPAAVVGALQGLLVTALMAFALDLSAGGWVSFTLVAVLAGVAFAAVNQALVAVLGGVGRFVALVVAVVGLATAVVSTVPGVLDAVLRAVPLAPALDGLQAVVTGQGGVGGAATRLVVWALVGLAATTAAVARTRVVPAAVLARGLRPAATEA